MSLTPDAAAIFEYHRAMAVMHGRGSSLALGWKDVHSQQVRFKMLAGGLRSRSRDVRYTGVEQIPALLEEAIKRHGHLPGACFLTGNFTALELPPAHYVFASGSLNYRSADPDFIYAAIRKLYSACRKGLAFNLLRQIIPNDLLVAYRPEIIADYCATICPQVQLVEGYASEDFTVYMYKQGRGMSEKW